MLSSWPAGGGFDVSLESKDDLPLPQALSRSFESGQAIALESGQGVSLYFYLDRHDAVLVLPGSLKRLLEQYRVVRHEKIRQAAHIAEYMHSS